MDFNEEEDELLEEELEEQNNEGFANEEDANPSSSEQFSDEELLNEEAPKEEASPLQEAADTTIEVKKAVAKKEILSVLLKSPWFWGAVGIIVLIFLAVLIFHMDFDLFGVGEPKPELYPTPACGKVFLTWEKESYTKEHQDDPDYEPITDPSLVDKDDEERFEYKEYEYDEFVAGVIWTDNYNAKDVDNAIMYQAMAIAARSELIATLPNNCVVLKYYNEQGQKFKELDGSEEKYAEIMTGVRSSNGMIIGLNGQIIVAKYEPFEYVKKRQEEDNRKYFYHMKNENEREQQVIPADWIDDIEQQKGTRIPKVKVADYVKLGSMSLYGGKYLLEKVDSQYDLYQILEYYYGRDIEYYRIDTSFLGNGLLGNGCMWWPVGGLLTTTENGITYSNGDPYSTDISSGFGNRNAPMAGASSNHKAVDITGHNLDGAINIVAVADGLVIASNTGCVRGDTSCGSGLGNYVKIQHSDGTVTRYGHMHTVYVSKGDRVVQGQVIGLMGSTGTSTGVHLDFQVLVNGVPVNPLNYVSATDPRSSCIIPELPGIGEALGGNITGGTAFTSGNDFIDWIAFYAVQDMHSSNILASITIAQAILESDWGRSSLAAKYNNIFGEKAGSSWNGKTVDLPTTECNVDGSCYKTIATWRVYDSPLDSLKGHSVTLSGKRYTDEYGRRVVGQKDYTLAAEIIKKGGYATDPDYVSKLVNIIEKYNLDQYDRM